jgi:hypothetical protein
MAQKESALLEHLHVVENPISPHGAALRRFLHLSNHLAPLHHRGAKFNVLLCYGNADHTSLANSTVGTTLGRMMRTLGPTFNF